MYPVLVQIGPLGLRTFPLVLAVAILVGGKLAAAEFRRRGLGSGLASDILMPAVTLGLVGSRLFHVLLFDPSWYLAHPVDVLSLWTGGLAFPGALVAGLGTAAWFCWRREVGFWRFVDGLVPSLMLGQAIGAVGSLLNGSSYGTPTTLPWAVVFADSRGQAPLGVPVHPTQLYEALAALLLFGGLWGVRTGLRRDGALLLFYLVGATALALLDLVKGDALWIGEAVPAGPVVSGLALIGAAVIRGRRRLAPAVPPGAPPSVPLAGADHGDGRDSKTGRRRRSF